MNSKLRNELADHLKSDGFIYVFFAFYFELQAIKFM